MTIFGMHPIVSRVRGPVVLAVLACAASSTLLPAASATSSRAGAVRAASTPQKIAYPSTVTMTTAKISHWAPVVSDVAARKDPSGHAPIVARVTPVTGDGTQNLMLILKQFNASPSQTWYDVRLAILPNNSTGWVPASALGTVYAVNTHLYIDQQTLTATLKRNGVTIFTTRVGVGEPYWPTPGGQFYVRDKLTDFHNPFYGPIAFGTSARSAVLTEWPGGGFAGVHGTDEPYLIPGRISHGCIRLLNSAIVKLSKLMSVGTPVTVSAPLEPPSHPTSHAQAESGWVGGIRAGESRRQQRRTCTSGRHFAGEQARGSLRQPEVVTRERVVSLRLDRRARMSRRRARSRQLQSPAPTCTGRSRVFGC